MQRNVKKLSTTSNDTRDLQITQSLKNTVQRRGAHGIGTNICESPGIDWNNAFNTTGIELHEPQYGIVIHGVRTSDLSVDDTTNIKVNKLEQENNTQVSQLAGDGTENLIMKTTTTSLSGYIFQQIP